MKIQAVEGARIVFDMPFAEYLADPALSRSELLDLMHSPRGYYALHRAPNRPPPKPPTPAQLVGVLCHCITLEPHAVLQRFCVKPAGIDLRTNTGKAWAAGVPPGVEVISDEQMMIAEAQREALRKHGEMGSFLEHPDARGEVSLFWTDARTGVRCKARIDLLVPAESDSGVRMVVIDLKTARDVSPAEFAKDAANYAYDVQAAFYTEAVERCTGVDVSAFSFAAVSASFPFLLQVYTIDDERIALEDARQLMGVGLTLYAQCDRFDLWPVFGESAQELLLPPYVHSKRQDEVTRIARLADYVRREATLTEGSNDE